MPENAERQHRKRARLPPETEAVRRTVVEKTTGDSARLEEGLADKIQTVSPRRLILRRFFRSKLSMAGLVMIVALFLFSFLGPVFSPWGQTEVDYDNEQGRSSYIERKIEFTVDGATYEIIDVARTVYTSNYLAPPSAKHWLGTDLEGRDVLTRIMYGGRISLMIGFIVVFMSMFIGVLLGGLAGYYGRHVEQIVMRVVDIFNCLPTLPLLLIISALLEAFGVKGLSSIYWLMLVLTFFSWTGTARLVRGQLLSLREQEFILAAEAMGVPPMRKIFRHLIPNVIPQLIVGMTLALGSVILYEAALSFLGLGVPLPYAAWGTMINTITRHPEILAGFPNVWIPPGLCIVTAVLAFNFIGDGLRDAFDPRAKR
ncbi:MAG: ABC transporter permease [Clostridiales bacterium]|jgi:peptide/nickel transport system permease protein|nr:ABC transporter permease [Clostridiales bacterium]